MGVSEADGVTPINIKVHPTTHSMEADPGYGSTDKGGVNARRDANRVPVLLATSNVDGETPVEIYCSIDGKLFLQTT